MRELPVPDPGTPDHRSAGRFIAWVAINQRRPLLGGVAFGVIWMLSQALVPAAIGKAIDAGVSARNVHQLAVWAGVVLLLGIVQAAAGIMRHRFAVTNWLSAAYRTFQVTVRHVVRLGATLPKRVASGEVVSIGTSDLTPIGNALDITARGSGAIVAIVAVATILLRASVPLGLVVIIGVPVLMGVVGLLIKPLHGRQQAYREQQGILAGRATDIVAGLRVLRGIGGEGVFARRYREHSQELRARGVHVARVESFLESAQVLLPGLFTVLVTWLGARFAIQGKITPGQLVAFYGYAAFLVFPLRTLTETVDKLTRGHVAARRVVKLLAVRPELSDPEIAAPTPAAGSAELVDPESGLVIRPSRFTAIAADEPEAAAEIADRIGRYVDGEVTLGGVRLADLPLARVRELILVVDNGDRLFSGPLRSGLQAGPASRGNEALPAPRGSDDHVDDEGRSDDERLQQALTAASALDIIDALPDGIDAEIAERGREFSGGQQQRLRLARALLADPPILVLVEPTSAVDAHTEARIAARLAQARSGRTTVVCTTSPLVLDRADHVVYVEDGKVVAEGRHAELLMSEPRYAATVTRGEDANE